MADRMTVDLFWQRYAFQPYELVEGRVLKTESPGFRHAIIAMRLMSQLSAFVERAGLGEVFGPGTPFRLSEQTLRMPRVSFVTQKKWQRVKYPYLYLPFAPDLAVEMPAPQATGRAVQALVGQYLRAGTQFLWLVHPQERRVVVFHRSGRHRSFKGEETLPGDPLLPGFKLPLAGLFPSR